MILGIWRLIIGCNHDYEFLDIRQEKHLFNVIKTHKYEICTKCNKIRDTDLY